LDEDANPDPDKPQNTHLSGPAQSSGLSAAGTSRALSHDKELSQGREFSIKPNPLEYFYEEKEISERVFDMHTTMHMVFRVGLTCGFAVAVWAAYTWQKQQKEIWEYAGKVTERVHRGPRRAEVQEDGSVVVKVDGSTLEVIPSDFAELPSVCNVDLCLRQAIFHLAQTESPQDYDFYKNKIKPEIQANFDAKLYDKILNQAKLSGPVYGVVTRSNKAGQRESSKEADSILSLFDEPCFKFYLIKYAEILGQASLISLIDNQSSALKISYYQKIKIVDFIMK